MGPQKKSQKSNIMGRNTTYCPLKRKILQIEKNIRWLKKAQTLGTCIYDK
jgi:hypothetical protein